MEILYILIPSVAIPLAIALLFFFICVCRNNQKSSRPPAPRQPKPVRGQNVEMSMLATAYKPKVERRTPPPSLGQIRRSRQAQEWAALFIHLSFCRRVSPSVPPPLDLFLVLRCSLPLLNHRTHQRRTYIQLMHDAFSSIICVFYVCGDVCGDVCVALPLTEKTFSVL